MEFFRKKILADDFLRHTGIMVAGTGLINIFNLVYQLALVRLLSVVEYGILNSLIAMMMVFSQFTVPFRPILARSFAVSVAKGQMNRARDLFRRATLDLSIIAVLIFLVFVLGRFPLARYQQIDDPFYIILVGILIGLATVALVPAAFLWGTQRFFSLAGLMASATFLKLVIGLILVWLGLKVSGAVGGYIITPLVFLIMGYVVINLSRDDRQENSLSGPPISMLSIYKHFIPTGIALFAFTVMTNFDVILVKHFFLPRQAGYYSVAQMVGKIILFFPGAVSVVVFPKSAAAQVTNMTSSRFLKKGLVIVILFDIVAFIICALAPSFVLRILTGKNDPESIRLVPWFALAMSFYALTWLGVFYNLSIHNIRFIIPLAVIALLQTAVIYLYHPTLRSVLAVLNISAIISFAATLVLSKSKNRPVPFRDIENAEISGDH